MGTFIRSAIIICALALAGSAAAQVQGRARVSVPLPEGRFILVSGGTQATYFLALDHLRRAGGANEAVVLALYDPGMSVDGRTATQIAAEVRIDCAKRTSTELGLSAYDADGNEIVAMPVGNPETLQGSVYYGVGIGMCGGMAQLPGQVVQGRAAAMRMAKAYREEARREAQAEQQAAQR